MIHDIPKPDISDDFTMEDLYKIKEWNYERRKDATIEEICADIEAGAARGYALLDALPGEKSVFIIHPPHILRTERVLGEKIETIS